MRILFTVQGEGRGHLTQALTLRRMLAVEGHEVTGVIVGKSARRDIPAFFKEKIDAPLYFVESPNFLPSARNTHIQLQKSIIYNLLIAPRYIKGVNFIRSEAAKADVVINFYELLTGLAFALHRPPCKLVCIGHQYLFLHPEFHFPAGHTVELSLLRFFTRLTALHADRILALSFTEMTHAEKGRLRIVPPLLREEVRQATATSGNYLHGYMLNSGFSTEIIKWHERHPATLLHFFWDKKGEKDVVKVDNRLYFHPLNDREFIRYMAGCKAYATTAGFESVCEAMYLGKPVMMVPSHIEQLCNAVDAERAGAGICSENFNIDRLAGLRSRTTVSRTFRKWADTAAQRIVGQVEATAAETAWNPALVKG